MPTIEVLHVTLADGPHGHSQALGAGRREQQVDVVVHENEGMDGDTVPGAGLRE